MRIHELHAPVKVLSRGAGRSAVAAAAYRSGERIVDERTGLVHDYTKKQGIENDALLLPANAPEWAHDRAKLWNEAEMREKHPRAQTARDLTVSFPSEFGQEQRREAGLRIGQWLVFRYGVAVDIAWHAPSREGDQRNHHAHFLFTTRRFDENGEWAQTKDRTLDDLKKGPEEITALRLAVADTLNNIAVRDRLEVYTEHLSFDRRGIEREPTLHLGPTASELERKGVETDIGNKNRDIQQRNEEREKLHAEIKEIDIEMAREMMKARQDQGQSQSPAPAPAREATEEADPYQSFYQETFARRASFLEQLEREHGEREKQLRQEVAGVEGAMASAGLFSRVWRNLTGRTRADLDRIAVATQQIQDIQRQRQTAQENFERERQQRLDSLKEDQRLKELRREAAVEQALQETRRVAVGESQAVRQAPSPAPAIQQSQPQARAPEPSQDSAAPVPITNYEARRREYFRRVGAARKAEREREADHPAPKEERSSSAPANDAAEKPAPPQSQYEARRAEYLKRTERGRQQPAPERGPSHEP